MNIRSTYLPLIGGIAAVVLGLLTMLFPTALISTVLIILGICVLIWGAICLFTVWQKRSVMPQVTLVQGIICVIAGLILIFAPKGTLRFISILIGLGAIAWGAMMLLSAKDNHKKNIWWLPGAINIVLGLLLLLLPQTALGFMIGLYVTFLGVNIILWSVFEGQGSSF